MIITQQQHQYHTHSPMTDSTLTQAQLSQAQTSSNTSSDSSASTSTSIAMNGDISARRDAASLMMTMSHLMGAHQAQQQHQGNPTTGVAGSLPSAQAVLNGMSNSHHNHTNRGPHKKRTASNAALDDTGGRSVAAHHLVNGGGVLRLPITGNTTASSVSSSMTDATATSATGAKGDKSIESPTANGSNAPLSEEEKKAERRAANRRSAFQSRQRRKILIEDLQRTVAALSKDNNDLRKTNDEIRSQLEAALIENRQLRQITSSLSAQAHAQVAAQSAPQQPASGPQAQQQQQQQQSSATSGSPNLSAQQAPVHKPPPTISVAPTPAPPASFNPAALTNFLTNFSSQVTAAAPADQQQHIFNAKLALMAAQTRVSELEHHQAAQAAAVAQQQQLQAHAAAFGLAQVQQQASNLNDAQHFARLQELLTLGISNASAAVAAANPAAAAPHPTAANGTNNAAGVDLTHLRCLLEAQQQQQQQATPTAPQAPESPSRSQSAPQEHESSKPTTETSNSFVNQSTTKGVEAPPTVTPPSPAPATSATNLPTSGTQDAPGIQLLIESLRSGQVAGNGQATGGAPLDEAVRNYIQQQQLAQQQQQQNSATSIKAESN